MSSHGQIKYIAGLIWISLHIVTSLPAKIPRPVIEIINEQSRSDDAIRTGILPYGNPLAGNSKQNARLHAQNQQAMFNAERIRQHRAQLQRWTKAPQQEDSYMKAYHESQENHQLALEQKLKDARIRTRIVQRMKPGPDVIKITKEDAMAEQTRKHRSHGSVDFKPYLQSKKFQTVVSLSAGTTYDQGVTIKPNGNIGLNDFLKSPPIPEENKLYTSVKPSLQDNKLYTTAIPSENHYHYPKQYGQMQNYQSAYEIDTLNSLLNKPAMDQLTELNALIDSEKHINDPPKDDLSTPLDLYFYHKGSDPSLTTLYEQPTYQIAPTYASAYPNPVKDHTPITEEIDDTEDPNKNNRLKHYGIQPVLATQADETIETTTIKSNNYYKVEVASQTISSPLKAMPYFFKEEFKPFEAYNPGLFKTNEGNSGLYLHHNAQPIGIQHLTGDGIGVSAYTDENLHYASNYEFGYRVRDQLSGNYFGHEEAKRGALTDGHYHVLLPDGRMQNVRYSAGPHGFHADISYEHSEK